MDLNDRPSQVSSNVSDIVTQQSALLPDGTYIELPCNAAPGPILKLRNKAKTDSKNDKQGGLIEHHRSWFQDPNTSQLTMDISLKQQQRRALSSAGASSSSGADAVQTHEDRSNQDVHKPSLPSRSTDQHKQHVTPDSGLPHAGLKTQVPAPTTAASASIPTDSGEAAIFRLLDPRHRATNSRDPAEAARKAALRVQNQSLVSNYDFREQRFHERIALFQKIILGQGLATSVSVLPELTWLSFDELNEEFVSFVLYDGAQTVFLCCLCSDFDWGKKRPEIVNRLAEWARYIHSADKVSTKLSSAANPVPCMRVAPIFILPKVYGKAWGRSDKKVMRQCKEHQVSLFTENPGALHVAQPWPPRKSSGQSDSTCAMRKEPGQMRKGQAAPRSNAHQLRSRCQICQLQPRPFARYPAAHQRMVHYRGTL